MMETLRKRADFLAAATGTKVTAAGFVLQILPRQDGAPARIGYTVSRKVGGAVERNRVKRRLRSIVRSHASASMRADHDYVLVGRRAALMLPFARVMSDFENALRQVHAAQTRTGRKETGKTSGEKEKI